MTRYLLIDTNLLFLFVVGSADLSYIGTYERLKGFSADDYDTLIRIISDKMIVLTPNTLSETSSFIRKVSPPLLDTIYGRFKDVILASEERTAAAQQVATQPTFAKLGLTDVTLLEILRAARPKSMTLLTTDRALAGKAESEGLPVINFHHLRFQ